MLHVLYVYTWQENLLCKRRRVWLCSSWSNEELWSSPKCVVEDDTINLLEKFKRRAERPTLFLIEFNISSNCDGVLLLIEWISAWVFPYLSSEDITYLTSNLEAYNQFRWEQTHDLIYVTTTFNFNLFYNMKRYSEMNEEIANLSMPLTCKSRMIRTLPQVKLQVESACSDWTSR